MSFSPPMVSQARLLAHHRSRTLRIHCLILAGYLHTVLVLTPLREERSSPEAEQQRREALWALEQECAHLRALGISPGVHTGCSMQELAHPVRLTEFVAGQLLNLLREPLPLVQEGFSIPPVDPLWQLAPPPAERAATGASGASLGATSASEGARRPWPGPQVHAPAAPSSACAQRGLLAPEAAAGSQPEAHSPSAGRPQQEPKPILLPRPPTPPYEGQGVGERHSERGTRDDDGPTLAVQCYHACLRVVQRLLDAQREGEYTTRAAVPPPLA